MSRDFVVLLFLDTFRKKSVWKQVKRPKSLNMEIRRQKKCLETGETTTSLGHFLYSKGFVVFPVSRHFPYSRDFASFVVSRHCIRGPQMTSDGPLKRQRVALNKESVWKQQNPLLEQKCHQRGAPNPLLDV